MQISAYDRVDWQSAIILGRRDAETLRRALARIGGPVAGRLRAALRHAILVPQAYLPAEVVALGSTVVVECPPEPVRELVVVEPWLAKGGPGWVSVLDPLGAALLGAAEGEIVEVEQADGSRMSARILAVDRGSAA